MTGDTTLEPIVSLLKSLQTETVAGFTVVQQLIEAAALRSFFFRP